MANTKFTLLSKYGGPGITDFRLIMNTWIPTERSRGWIVRKHGLMSAEEVAHYAVRKEIRLYCNSTGEQIDINPPESHSYCVSYTGTKSRNSIVCTMKIMKNKTYVGRWKR